MPVVRGVAAIMFLVLGACTGSATQPSDDAGTATTSPSGAAVEPTERGSVEAVTFDSADLTLEGDLRLPDSEGPHPGIVLVHGSGPNGRDGVVPGQLAMAFPQPVGVLADLAAALRDAGYAALIYDKRSCGSFNGCADNGYPAPADDLTIETFVEDAQAAVAYLRSRPEIRPEAVVVAGHSQGASFVPGMLLDDPRLAAGVLLAAPYDPVDALLAEQADTVGQIVGALDDPPPGAVGSITRLRQLARSVSDLRSGAVDDTTQFAGATAGFWRSWLRLSDGVPQLAVQAHQPLLVLNGKVDTNVGPEQTTRWRRTLTDVSDRVVALDCVSHALNCLHTDDPATVDPAEIDTSVDPRVPATIADFL
ncbi:MAG: alpha/beta hydrolase, partial [Actinobacteria bacterium]|nr:alpha/beta hydrolase [Actinomycetota bacterium]